MHINDGELQSSSCGFATVAIRKMNQTLSPYETKLPIFHQDSNQGQKFTHELCLGNYRSKSCQNLLRMDFQTAAKECGKNIPSYFGEGKNIYQEKNIQQENRFQKTDNYKNKTYRTG